MTEIKKRTLHKYFQRFVCEALAMGLCLTLVSTFGTVRAFAAELPEKTMETGPVPEEESPVVPEAPVLPGAIPVPPEADAPASSTQADIQTDSTQPAWNLVLINARHLLPEDFSVPELTRLSNGLQVDSRVYPALEAMLDAAREEGFHPLVCSAYRTTAKQTQLYERKVRYYRNLGYSRKKAEDKAAFWVARPGTSEHQAGLAVDIVSLECQVLDSRQEKTLLQQWLMAHCAEYGFILRYPTDQSAITGVGYEPWHYRYVGVEAAKEITERGVTLEEYLCAAEYTEQSPSAENQQ